MSRKTGFRLLVPAIPHKVALSRVIDSTSARSGVLRAKAHGSCFAGPAFAEAASRRQAEPSEAYPTALVRAS
jgi:hypothetical protein